MSLWTRLSLLCVAALLFVGGAYLMNFERALHLERQLQAAQAEIEKMHIDHRDTLDAITSALDTREAIHEQAKLREQKLQKTLESDPLADVPISDELWMCIQWDAQSGECEVAAPVGAAGGHPDPGSQKGQDGR